MTRNEIIQGLKFTIEMFLLNPTTGETYTEPRNDMDKTTIDACRGAIKLLESEKDKVILTKKEYGELVSSEFDNGYAKGFREALEQEPSLDKIRAEIAEYGSIRVSYAITKDTKTDKGIEKLVSDVLKRAKEQVLDIIDKYKESEG